MTSPTDHGHRKRAIRDAFNRAADSYDGAAGVQREICIRLAGLAAANPPVRPPRRILDAGCGTGYGADLIARKYPGSGCVAVDFAPAMLARLAYAAGAGPAPLAVCADLESLPFASGSIDAIWSSLALQWCDPALALGEFARVLRPGGSTWIATLGPQTLAELRDAFAAIDDAAHVIRFHGLDAWRRDARDAGFDVVDERNQAAFALAPDLRGLIRHIKSIGAHTVTPASRRPPVSRAAWRTMGALYERHRRPDGLLPATYDAIFLALVKR